MRERTPLELLNWCRQKMDQICSTDEGRRILRLQKGFAKQFIEEVYPLALFGHRKFGNANGVILQPVIGNQHYDAVVTDLRTNPASQSFLEITQSHEGQDNYWRRHELYKEGRVFPYAPIVKTGTRKSKVVSIPPEATSVERRVEGELAMIVAAAKRKEGGDYPLNTSLVLVFDDAPPFQKVMGNERLDGFVRRNIMSLGLRFSMLYLVGRHSSFREFSLGSMP